MTPEPTEAAVEAKRTSSAAAEAALRTLAGITTYGPNRSMQSHAASVLAAYIAWMADDRLKLSRRVEALEADLRLAREDAERWRYLLSNPRGASWREASTAVVGVLVPKRTDTCAYDDSPAAINAAIDAARQESANG